MPYMGGADWRLIAFLLIAFLYALSIMLGQWVGPPTPAQFEQRKQTAQSIIDGSASAS